MMDPVARGQEALRLWNQGRDAWEIAEILGVSPSKAREILGSRCRIPYEEVRTRDNTPFETMVCTNPNCGKTFRYRHRRGPARLFCTRECGELYHLDHANEVRRQTNAATKVQRQQEAGNRFRRLLKHTNDHLRDAIKQVEDEADEKPAP